MRFVIGCRSASGGSVSPPGDGNAPAGAREATWATVSAAPGISQLPAEGLRPRTAKAAKAASHAGS